MTLPRLHGPAHDVKRRANPNPPERRNSIMKSTLFAVLYSFIAIFIFTSAVQAQNTGGVFPPGFGDNHESIQYRISVDANTGGFANRLHYQKSINSNFLWRVLAQTRETDSSDFDFDFVQAELFWEFGETSDKWRKGLRFDARIRDEDRPGQFGINFNNQWNLDDGWSARLVLLSNVQIGESDGIGLAPRAQIGKKLESGPSIGLQYFGNFGNTQDFSVGKTGQTIGPFVSTKLFGKTSLYTGVQFGVTEVAPDTELRLWLTQGF